MSNSWKENGVYDGMEIDWQLSNSCKKDNGQGEEGVASGRSVSERQISKYYNLFNESMAFHENDRRYEHSHEG